MHLLAANKYSTAKRRQVSIAVSRSNLQMSILTCHARTPASLELLIQLPCYTANGVCAMPQVPNPPGDRKKHACPCDSCCWRLRAFND